MKFIEPKVEWWQQTTLAQHIARVGRICYKAKGKQPEEGMTEEEVEAFIQKRDEERCKDFLNSGHRSMYRHGTVYFFMPSEKGLPNYIWAYLNASPYIDYATKNHKVWISTNMQFMLENKNLMDALSPYGVSEDEFIEKAQKYECEEAFSIIRMTLVVTTQISTSRELNRTSPNSIAEQSTRYCNMEKKGGVQIARPHWYDEGTLLICAIMARPAHRIPMQRLLARRYVTSSLSACANIVRSLTFNHQYKHIYHGKFNIKRISGQGNEYLPS